LRCREVGMSEHAKEGVLVHPPKLSCGGSVSKMNREEWWFTIKQTRRRWLTGGLKYWEQFVQLHEQRKWAMVKKLEIEGGS